MSAAVAAKQSKAPEPYLIGHVVKRTEKGGILVETLVDGIRKEAWFGEKIVKTDKNGAYFVPNGAVMDKTGLKARLILPGYEEEMGWSAQEEVAEDEAKPEQKMSKKELMRRCVRAAKEVVDEELCCEFAITERENVQARIDAVLRLALSFYIDETKNARMKRIK